MHHPVSKHYSNTLCVFCIFYEHCGVYFKHRLNRVSVRMSQTYQSHGNNELCLEKGYLITAYCTIYPECCMPSVLFKVCETVYNNETSQKQVCFCSNMLYVIYSLHFYSVIKLEIENCQFAF